MSKKLTSYMVHDTETLDYRKPKGRMFDGVMECWSVGVLECWNVGMLE
ncbi:MAG: hypothetical protein HY961_05875 [Ignavibacteriae bacterium]|nr:hypothetical protein [Ignavibacteriota bacterium]